MLAYTYIENGKFKLIEKTKPIILNEKDAIVKVTLASICSSDLHIKHGSVPKAKPGITVGHEMVGIVEEVGEGVKKVKPNDRVCVNVETFCGECFFCQRGFVNNCEDENGGWALGCRIDGGQTAYVRVPYTDQGLILIDDEISDEQAFLVGDVLATGYWAMKISEIKKEDTVLIIGAGLTGICTLLCVMLKTPKQIIIAETDEQRISFIKEHYPNVIVFNPLKKDAVHFIKQYTEQRGADKQIIIAETDEQRISFIKEHYPNVIVFNPLKKDAVHFIKQYTEQRGADVVLEVAGTQETFKIAWEYARANAIATIVALYEKNQSLPLPKMYRKNLTFKTGGVDGCDCDAILQLIKEGKIDTTPLITHTYPLEQIEEAYELFENKRDGVIKVAIKP